LPRKSAKVPVRQSFIGNVVEVQRRCFVIKQRWVEEEDVFDSIHLVSVGEPIILRKGERGLCVEPSPKHKGKVRVLIRGELLSIARRDLRVCISA
jgi:hypothetical protein